MAWVQTTENCCGYERPNEWPGYKCTECGNTLCVRKGMSPTWECGCKTGGDMFGIPEEDWFAPAGLRNEDVSKK